MKQVKEPSNRENKLSQFSSGDKLEPNPGPTAEPEEIRIQSQTLRMTHYSQTTAKPLTNQRVSEHYGTTEKAGCKSGFAQKVFIWLCSRWLLWILWMCVDVGTEKLCIKEFPLNLCISYLLVPLELDILYCRLAASIFRWLKFAEQRMLLGGCWGNYQVYHCYLFLCFMQNKVCDSFSRMTVKGL